MRKKLIFFKDNETRENIIEPGKPLFESIKGAWRSKYFKNSNKLILELGCGRGDYTTGLAEMHPDKNFIGVDVKGDRIWYGSGSALEKGLSNVAFLRTQVDLLKDYFETGEVDEIWITFPGPRPKKSHAKKRLTSSKFLDIYKRVLKPGGIVHLKTDSDLMYEFTLETLENRDDISSLESVSNLYEASGYDDVKGIQTHFEKSFLRKGKTIKYIRFSFSDS